MSTTTTLPRLPRAMLIGTDWTETGSLGTIPVIDPADGSTIGAIPAGGAQEVDRAVAHARAAFADGRWSRLHPRERARRLNALADLIDLHADELALIETLDNGMPLAQARNGHVPAASATFRYYASWCDKLDGRSVNLSDGDNRFHAYTLLDPVGVVAIITPWNAPIVTVAKLAPALAAGCCCILKPAEDTSLTALRVAELALEAGIPAGAIQVVTGRGGAAGAALAAHPGVDKVTFTGSTATGRAVIHAAAGNLKKVSLELGGKSPVVVMDDAEMARAIPGAASAVFANAGQICSAGTRLYVQRKSFDEVVAGVAKIAADMRLGSGRDPASEMGPLVSARQFERVSALVESGRAEGATVLTGGGRARDEGFFFQPTVFADVTPEMRIVREEIFGPVLVAMPFDDPAEIATLANASDYGLAAAIFTRDLATAHRFGQDVRAGTIWINTYHMVDLSMPWGGFGQSGWGRENGWDGIAAYLQPKSIVAQL